MRVELKTDGAAGLAKLVRGRYDSAVMHRNTSPFMGSTLGKLLLDCHNQRYGILSAEEYEACADLKGINFNITDIKVQTYQAAFRDTIAQNLESLFTIAPTPEPELSDTEERAVADKLKQGIVGRYQQDGAIDRSSSLDLITQTKALKKASRQAKFEAAKLACAAHSTLMKDQYVEGGFAEAFLAFLDDFATFPIAWMKFSITMKRMGKWTGNKWSYEYRKTLTYSRISPFNMFWSGDKDDVQLCSHVTEVIHLNKLGLRLLEGEIYDTEAVNRVIHDEVLNTGKLDWLAESPQDRKRTLWGDADLVPALNHRGVFYGSDIEEFVSGVDPKMHYWRRA